MTYNQQADRELSRLEERRFPLKWYKELTADEQKSYPLSRIKLGFDKAISEYYTADQVFVM